MTVKGCENWHDYILGFSDTFELGKDIGPEAVSGVEDETGKKNGPKVIICSPHPDDEADCGGLALRLRREQDAHVINIAMTLGREADRKAARKDEMAAACKILGFDWQLAVEPKAWENLRKENITKMAAEWQEKINTLADILISHNPDIIIFPHADDQHPTHVAVHHLARSAAEKYSRKNSNKKITVAETECWRPLLDPNLLLGLDQNSVALLVAALSAHQGEMARTPYNLFYPARLMNNVWRGSELVAGFGAKSPTFIFGELYRISTLEKGQLKRHKQPRILEPKTAINMTNA